MTALRLAKGAQLRPLSGLTLCLLALSGNTLIADDEFDRQFYIGVGGGLARVSAEPAEGAEPADTVSDSVSSRTFAFGRDFSRRWSATLTLSDIGELELNDNDDTVTYESVSLTGDYYLTNVLSGGSAAQGLDARLGLSLLGRLGIGQLDTDATIALNTDRPVGPVFGAGLEYAWTSGIVLRSDLMYLDGDTSEFTLRLQYRMGGNQPRRPIVPLADAGMDSDPAVNEAPEMTQALAEVQDEDVALEEQRLAEAAPVQELSQEEGSISEPVIPPDATSTVDNSDDDVPQVALFDDSGLLAETPDDRVYQPDQPDSVTGVSGSGATVGDSQELNNVAVLVDRVEEQVSTQGCDDTNRLIYYSEILCLKPDTDTLPPLYFDDPLNAKLSDPSLIYLRNIARVLDSNSEWRLELRGHASDRLSDTEAMELARVRMRAVAAFLIDLGIDRGQFGRLIAFGNRVPPEGLSGTRSADRLEFGLQRR